MLFTRGIASVPPVFPEMNWSCGAAAVQTLDSHNSLTSLVVSGQWSVHVASIDYPKKF